MFADILMLITRLRASPASGAPDEEGLLRRHRLGHDAHGVDREFVTRG
jgi:hypothetical protein